MADKIPALVQLPLFGHRTLFRDPVLDVDDKALSAVYTAFKPWHISLENITFKENPASLGEEATNFSLLGGRFLFSINVGGCGVLVKDPNWSEANLVMSIAGAGIGAVLEATDAVVDKQLASLTMHLTLKTGTIREITSRFVNLDADQFPGGPLKSFGFSLYREDFTWVVDASAAFLNSLFLRMDRWFRPDIPLEQIARQLHEDENRVLDLLGLEVN
jgi:hypothetical protein